MEDPVVPLERNLYGHPLAGLLWERQFEKILFETRLGESFQFLNAYSYTVTKDYSYHCMWAILNWLARNRTSIRLGKYSTWRRSICCGPKSATPYNPERVGSALCFLCFCHHETSFSPLTIDPRPTLCSGFRVPALSFPLHSNLPSLLPSLLQSVVGLLSHLKTI